MKEGLQKNLINQAGVIIENRDYTKEELEKCQFQATGGDFAKVFDVQNKKFVTISCTKCEYTELYKKRTSAGMNIFDFLMN